jgi:hypothetical protein
MTNSTTFPGTVTATTFAGSGANLTSIPAGQLTGSFSGNTAFDTTTLVIDGTNNRVGAGTATPQKTLEVAGPTRITDGLSNVCDLSIGQILDDYDTGTKIQAGDIGSYDDYGTSNAISDDGTKIIVGAYREDQLGSDAGAAYIYTYNGSSWSQQQKILASDAQAGDRFGQFVDMSGDGTKVIVGAYFEDTGGNNAGSAYIYAYNSSSSSWAQEQKIQAPSPANSRTFGSTVAINENGTKVYVGEPGGNSGKGHILVYTYNGSSWSQVDQITGSDTANQSWLGHSGPNNHGTSMSLSRDGTVLAVFAYMYNVGSYGRAYIFKYNGSSWSEQEYLNGSNGGAYFGSALALSDDGTTLIVGALGNTSSGNTETQGAAKIYTYDGSSWSLQQIIPNADVPIGAKQFGNAVAINGAGTRVVVGARASTENSSTNTGSARVFNYVGSSWVLDKKYLPTDLQASDAFGWNLTMSQSGQFWAAGSPYNDTPSSDAGAVYIFKAPLVNALLSSTAISAAGTTLSFTGQHMCVPEGPMYRGLVVSANKNRYVSLNGALTTGVGAIRSSESLPVVSLSNVVSDQSVFGVVERLEQGGTTERRQVVGATVVTAQKEMGDNRVIVNSLGEGAIWVANTNGNLVSGDYMTTSHLTGYGQKQDVENLQNSTVAKITMDCDFDPDDVPIQVIKKNDTGNNDLDPYGRIQWEDHPLKTTQKAYVIRYLTVDGNRTDEANAVHRSALVGCTYHCG